MQTKTDCDPQDHDALGRKKVTASRCSQTLITNRIALNSPVCSSVQKCSSKCKNYIGKNGSKIASLHCIKNKKFSCQTKNRFEPLDSFEGPCRGPW